MWSVLTQLILSCQFGTSWLWLLYPRRYCWDKLHRLWDMLIINGSSLQPPHKMRVSIIFHTPFWQSKLPHVSTTARGRATGLCIFSYKQLKPLAGQIFRALSVLMSSTWLPQDLRVYIHLINLFSYYKQNCFIFLSSWVMRKLFAPST